MRSLCHLLVCLLCHLLIWVPGVCSFLYSSVTVEEEEEFCDGSDVSDYDSDDSNGTLLPSNGELFSLLEKKYDCLSLYDDSAEAHPRTEYPEEISEEEEEEEEEDDDDKEDEEEKSEASDESEDEEKSERHVRMVLGDEEDEFDGYAEDVNCCSGESDDEEFEYTKWSYR